GIAILETARRINAGDGSLLSRDDGSPIVWRGSADEITFSGVELLTNPARDLDAFLARWEHQLADSKTSALATRVYDAPGGTLADGDRDVIFHLFERLSRHRILCVTRVGAVGSERVNSHMHRRAAARAGVRGTRPMLPGEPVMVLRNDYERRLFNGDQG